ncbi:hypothetical protein CRG98_038891 [Punica granatum]|uniref:Uncharacterized protein n=1 Tax=Punica granatum TaxID=22663 RepID=A0A2I0IAM0_PUNGR|nr:hypothetical protein CRG98_038891 [Punica granatum]
MDWDYILSARKWTGLETAGRKTHGCTYTYMTRPGCARGAEKPGALRRNFSRWCVEGPICSYACGLVTSLCQVLYSTWPPPSPSSAPYTWHSLLALDHHHQDSHLTPNALDRLITAVQIPTRQPRQWWGLKGYVGPNWERKLSNDAISYTKQRLIPRGNDGLRVGQSIAFFS